MTLRPIRRGLPTPPPKHPPRYREHHGRRAEHRQRGQSKRTQLPPRSRALFPHRHRDRRRAVRLVLTPHVVHPLPESEIHDPTAFAPPDVKASCPDFRATLDEVVIPPPHVING